MRTMHLLMLLCSLVWLSSCSSETDPCCPPGAGIPVTFGVGLSAELGGVSRAGSTNELTGDIGLFVVKGTAGLKASGNYAHNVKLTCTNGVWSTATPIFYPADGASLHFYAYYPYNENITDPTTHTFEVYTKQNIAEGYNQSLLMLAKTTDATVGNSPVTLAFAHALSMVQVKLLKGETEYANLDDNLKLALTSVLRLTTLSWDAPPTSTGTATSIQMYKVPDADHTYRALVPAQTLSANATVTMLRSDGTETNTKYTGIGQATLTAGNVHKYEVTLNPQAAQTYAVGEVYPRTGTPQGIVFYITAGGLHGLVVSLDEGEELEFCTSTTTTGAIDLDNGLANMSAVYGLNPGFTNYPASEWVHAKNGGGTTNYYNAFLGTWYLPAINELKKLVAAYNGLEYEKIANTWPINTAMPGWDECETARAAFNKKLTDAGGMPLTDNDYCSSTEHSSSQYTLYLSNKGYTGTYPKNGSFPVRAIMAF